MSTTDFVPYQIEEIRNFNTAISDVVLQFQVDSECGNEIPETMNENGRMHWFPVFGFANLFSNGQ